MALNPTNKNNKYLWCSQSVPDEGVTCVLEDKLTTLLKKYIGFELSITIEMFETETKEIKSIVTKNQIILNI